MDIRRCNEVKRRLNNIQDIFNFNLVPPYIICCLLSNWKYTVRVKLTTFFFLNGISIDQFIELLGVVLRNFSIRGNHLNMDREQQIRRLWNDFVEGRYLNR